MRSPNQDEPTKDGWPVARKGVQCPPACAALTLRAGFPCRTNRSGQGEGWPRSRAAACGAGMRHNQPPAPPYHSHPRHFGSVSVPPPRLNSATRQQGHSPNGNGRVGALADLPQPSKQAAEQQELLRVSPARQGRCPECRYPRASRPAPRSGKPRDPLMPTVLRHNLKCPLAAQAEHSTDQEPPGQGPIWGWGGAPYSPARIR